MIPGPGHCICIRNQVFTLISGNRVNLGLEFPDFFKIHYDPLQCIYMNLEVCLIKNLFENTFLFGCHHLIDIVVH